MNDPLRHAMGLRSAQDACKMRMWNSFPSLFQNTIFHGEQDASIKQLRHGGQICERLARARELKEAGNASLKANPGPIRSANLPKPSGPSQDEKDLIAQLQQIDQNLSEKELELQELRSRRKALKDTLTNIE